MGTDLTLDRQDRRLLHTLSVDPNASIAELAERSQLSRDQVAYRLERFSRQRIVVRYFPLIPLQRLGYSHYLFRLKLRSATEKRIDELVRFLVGTRAATWVARIQGEFDIGISLRCRSGEEVTQFVDSLLERHNELILERSFAMYTRVGYFARDYLAGKKSRRYVEPAAPVSSFSSLDRVGRHILKLLAGSSRTRPSEIAAALVEAGTVGSITREAVAYRIKKLESEGWLQGAWLVLNPAIEGIVYCKIEIVLEHVSTAQLEKFASFCRQHPRVVLFFRLIGQWDFEIDIEVETHAQAREFVMQLTEQNQNTVRDYTMLFITALDKWDTSSAFDET